MRGTKSFSLCQSHTQCSVEEQCQFCLVRSVIKRINDAKGRQKIIPVELECIKYENIIGKWSHLHQLLKMCIERNKEFKTVICPEFSCLSCNSTVSTDNEIWIDLHQAKNDETIYDLIEKMMNELREKHQKESRHSYCKESYIVLNENQQTIIFAGASMVVNLNENIFVGGKYFKCISAATSSTCYFRNNENWYSAVDTIQEVFDYNVDGISLALYESIDFPDTSVTETTCYAGKEIETLRNKQDRHLDKGDRHTNKEKRNN